MSEPTLMAEPRSVVGKKVKRLRKEGKVPAVVYGPTLTETVRAFRAYLPDYFPLPHPSPRNGPWLLRHAWFASDVLPALRAEVRRALM